MQFPGEAEGLRRPRRRHAPRIVRDAPQHPTRIIEGLPHAAEGVADVPRATQGAQARVAVHVGVCAITEHLAQRRGEILRVGGGAVIDQDTVAVVGITGLSWVTFRLSASLITLL